MDTYRTIIEPRAHAKLDLPEHPTDGDLIRVLSGNREMVLFLSDDSAPNELKDTEKMAYFTLTAVALSAEDAQEAVVAACTAWESCGLAQARDVFPWQLLASVLAKRGYYLESFLLSAAPAESILLASAHVHQDVSKAETSDLAALIEQIAASGGAESAARESDSSVEGDDVCGWYLPASVLATAIVRDRPELLVAAAEEYLKLVKSTLEKQPTLDMLRLLKATVKVLQEQLSIAIFSPQDGKGRYVQGYKLYAKQCDALRKLEHEVVDSYFARDDAKQLPTYGQEILNAAEDFKRRNNPEGTLKLYRLFVDNFPNDPQCAAYLEAVSELYAALPEARGEANETLRELIARYPATEYAARAALRLAVWLQANGQADEGNNLIIKTFTEPASSGVAPFRPHAAFVLARCEGKLGKLEARDRRIKAMLTDFPQSEVTPAALLWLCSKLVVETRAKEAVEIWNRVVSEYPGTASATTALERLQGANEFLQRARPRGGSGGMSGGFGGSLNGAVHESH